MQGELQRAPARQAVWGGDSGEAQSPPQLWGEGGLTPVSVLAFQEQPALTPALPPS